MKVLDSLFLFQLCLLCFAHFLAFLLFKFFLLQTELVVVCDVFFFFGSELNAVCESSFADAQDHWRHVDLDFFDSVAFGSFEEGRVIDFVADHGAIFCNCNEGSIFQVDTDFSCDTIILIKGLFFDVQVGIVLVPELPTSISVANQQHVGTLIVTHVGSSGLVGGFN